LNSVEIGIKQLVVGRAGPEYLLVLVDGFGRLPNQVVQLSRNQVQAGRFLAFFKAGKPSFQNTDGSGILTRPLV
jgi:hypothetical protein